MVSVPVEGDLTSPDLAPAVVETLGEHVFDGPEPDTQVGPAPTADSWDGPTNVGTEDELAELAAASVSRVEEETVLADTVRAESEAAWSASEAAPNDAEVAPAEGEAAKPTASRCRRWRRAAWRASSRACSTPAITRSRWPSSSGSSASATAASSPPRSRSLRARREESGVQVMQAAGGWQLRTNPENVAWVSRILAGKPPRLSRALLETLAIVAYRQPITRPEIDEIRGVDCGPVLKTLLDRSLVRMIGKKEEVGRPILYGTTPEFLRTFSLRDLTELPTLREFHELGEAEMAKVAAATPRRRPRAEAPPKPAAIREVDPAEEDALLGELDRATAAASQAAVVPAETTVVVVDDETVG